jgi:hypothetical protein
MLPVLIPCSAMAALRNKSKGLAVWLAALPAWLLGLAPAAAAAMLAPAAPCQLPAAMSLGCTAAVTACACSTLAGAAGAVWYSRATARTAAHHIDASTARISSLLIPAASFCCASAAREHPSVAELHRAALSFVAARPPHTGASAEGAVTSEKDGADEVRLRWPSRAYAAELQAAVDAAEGDQARAARSAAWACTDGWVDRLGGGSTHKAGLCIKARAAVETLRREAPRILQVRGRRICPHGLAVLRDSLHPITHR